MSHDPGETSRTFKKHCSKWDTWNQVTVHRLPTDGDWDEAHPYFCADCGHQLGTERGFRISVERIEISDSHTDLNRSATFQYSGWTRLCKILMRVLLIEVVPRMDHIRPYLQGHAHFRRARPKISLCLGQSIGRKAMKETTINIIDALRG